MSENYAIPPVSPIQRVESFIRRVLKLDKVKGVEVDEAVQQVAQEKVEEELPPEERYKYTAADPMVGKYIDYLA